MDALLKNQMNVRSAFKIGTWKLLNVISAQYKLALPANQNPSARLVTPII